MSDKQKGTKPEEKVEKVAPVVAATATEGDEVPDERDQAELDEARLADAGSTTTASAISSGKAQRV